MNDKNIELEKLLNKNQIAYLMKSKSKFNIKSCGISSGAYYLDTTLTVFNRVHSLKDKRGLCLLLFPAMSVARNRFDRVGIRINKEGIINVDGEYIQVAGVSGNPKKLSTLLLNTNLKYVYGADMQQWKEETFMSIIRSVKSQDCIFDGVISDLNVNHWVMSFLRREENLYTQDDFSTENNIFISEDRKEILLSMFSKEQMDGFKFKDNTEKESDG